jgi:hypothetical protein
MTASIYYICVDARDYAIVEMNSLAQTWHGITQDEIEARRPTVLDFDYPSQDRIIQCINEVHRTQQPVDFSHNIENDYLEGPGLWKVEFHPGPRNADHVCWFATSLNDIVDSVVESFGSGSADEGA